MLMDVHTHIGSAHGIDATAAQLVASMDESGVSKSLVFAADLFNCPTEKLLQEIQPFQGRLYAVAAVSVETFDLDVVAELEKLLAEGRVHGVKVYTGYEHVFPYDKRFRDLFRLMARHQRPVIFHCGDTFKPIKSAKLKYAHPIHVDDVATDCPETQFVIAHLGWPWHRDAGEVACKNENVWLDCSGFVYGRFTDEQRKKFNDVLAETVDVAGGNSKILFGSDWPISSQIDYVEVATPLLPDSTAACRLFGVPAC